MEDGLAGQTARATLADDPGFCLRVTSPKDKRTLIYQTSDVRRRFYMDNRFDDLKEVKYDAAAPNAPA